MSRHRNMRHMIAEEDYGYDDDDDYYDDYIAAPKAKTSGSSKKKKKTAATAAAAATTAGTTTTGAAAKTTTGAAAAAIKSTTTTQQQQQQQQPTPKKTSMIITPAKSAAAAASSSQTLEVVRPPSSTKATTSSSSSGGGLTVIAAARPSSSLAAAAAAPPPPPGFHKTPPSSSSSLAEAAAAPPGFHNNKINAAPVTISTATTTPTATTTAAAPSTMTTTAIPQVLLQRQTRPSLTCVVLGHVDAGKSTLTGHLLWKAAAAAGNNSNASNNWGKVSQQQQQRPTPPPKNMNFAWLLDEDEEERKHGVTMDVATKMLYTPRYNICLQDAPGHADYVPCMITGTANADAAIVVVDVTDRKTIQPLVMTPGGNKKASGDGSSGGGSGSSSGSGYIGQLREHLVLAKGLGITQLIIVINKMDVKHWNQELYLEVQQIVQDFLTRQLGFAINKLQFLPASGLTGVNIMEKPNSKDNIELSSWYNNNNNNNNNNNKKKNAAVVPVTLFEALDRLELPGAAGKQQQAGGGGGGGCGGLLAKPLRIVLTDVGVATTTNKRGVSVRGKVMAGWVKVGQSVTLLPMGDVAILQKLSRLVDHHEENDDDDNDNNKNNNNNERSLYGAAGEVVDMVLMGVDLARLAVGTLLAPAWSLPTMLPMVSNHCRCKIYVLDAVPIPIIRGATASFHMHHLDVPCHVNKLIETLSSQQADNSNKMASQNNNNNSDVNKKKRPPRALTARTTALVEITLLTAIAMESFSDCRPLGRFVLRRGGDSIAVGRIEQVLPPTVVGGS